jgi:hypothetical protein
MTNYGSFNPSPVLKRRLTSMTWKSKRFLAFSTPLKLARFINMTRSSYFTSQHVKRA